MDFELTPEQEAFREEIRSFLRAELADEPGRVREDGWVVGFSRAFSEKLGKRGWLGLTWPRQYGGQARSVLERLILTEELLRAGAPVAAHWLGDRQVGPSILRFGTEEQRREILPRITSGAIVFCVGLSEPDAGSDAAAVTTRAVEDGDGFVLRGQKIWTSFAHQADYCYLVARTDASGPKHKGISEFIVPMATPGITVRPLLDMTGEHHFNEVFFEDARVPRGALIGQKDRGWYQIAVQLDYERGGIERVLSNWPLLEDALAALRGHAALRDPIVRDRLAGLRVDLETARLMVYRIAWLADHGRVPNVEAAVAKAFGTELEQRIAETVAGLFQMSALGMAGSRHAALGGRVARAVLYAPAYTIQGGTSNILRNIIAHRGLGLPAD
ncbi:MAG TPA: acyl-CoA dehydrogenase family protein [Methylomirabilota bacterium]|nr:acyl-CoA dehydrogenase family protein [Methylomirabilota bacterium]